MSLINDMLKDLDAGKREPLPEGVFLDGVPEDRDRRPSRFLVMLALVLAVIPVAFYLGLHWRGADLPLAEANSLETSSHETNSLGNSSVEVNSSEVVQPSSLEVDPIRASSVATSAESDDGEAAVRELLLKDSSPIASGEDVARKDLIADSKPASGDQFASAKKIDQLLNAAKLALRDDRLTSPLDDNAFSRYQAVLLLEPSHPQALEGVKRIAARYLEFYTSTRRQGDRQAANYYLDKARRVANRYPELASWLDKDIAMLAEEVAQTRAEASPSPAESPSEAGTETETETETQSAAQEESRGAVDSQTVRRSPSKSEVDKRVAAQAQTLIEQGRYSQAEALLLSQLENHPQSTVSREALFEVYLATDKLTAAQAQVQDLNHLPEHEQLQMKARIKMHEGDMAAAMTLMEGASPVLREAPAYYSYLAAMYHRAERFADAASLYQQLLAVADNQPTYWLGLAVSLDALNDRQGALRAFHYARRYSNADSPSRRYVDERIQNLSS